MERKCMHNPSFFTILINIDSTRQLRLPPSFTVRYRGILPENALLRISSGETWDVKLEQMEDEDYYFTRGWNKFVNDLNLKVFEFLIFRFNIGKSTFDVSAYGINACEKEFKSLGPTNFQGANASGVKNKESRPRIVKNDETKPDNCSNNPRFEIVLKKHQRSRVSIRKHFAESSGLIGKKKVGLDYPGGHKACVALDLSSRKSQFQLDLARGWSDFRKANGLTYGERYSFEFIPSEELIQVKQIK